MIKTIVKNENGRWCIVEKELTCGNTLYVYIPGNGWTLGRIEHSEKFGGYYFLSSSDDCYRLCENIEVRTVQEQNELIRASRL